MLQGIANVLNRQKGGQFITQNIVGEMLFW